MHQRSIAVSRPHPDWPGQLMRCASRRISQRRRQPIQFSGPQLQRRKVLHHAMAKMIPLGRGGTPEEAADAVYLFCSPESNYISGQVVVCGGGLLI